MRISNAALKRLSSTYDVSANDLPTPCSVDELQAFFRRHEIEQLADEWGVTEQEVNAALDTILYDDSTHPHDNIPDSLIACVEERVVEEGSRIKIAPVKHNYCRYGVLSGAFVLHVKAGTRAPTSHAVLESAYVTPAGIGDDEKPDWLGSLVFSQELPDSVDGTQTVYRQERHNSLHEAHKWVAERVSGINHIQLQFSDFSAGVAINPRSADDELEVIDIPSRPLNLNALSSRQLDALKRQYGDDLSSEDLSAITNYSLVDTSNASPVVHDSKTDTTHPLVKYRDGVLIPRPAPLEYGADGGEYVVAEQIRDRYQNKRYTACNHTANS